MESVLKPIQPVSVTPNVSLGTNSSSNKNNIILAGISIFVILAGVGTGYLISKKGGSGSLGSKSNTIVINKNEAGIADESKFSTTTDGVLEEGGIGGEGMFHLVRGNGPSQYAYLTSSTVDMSTFVGKKVQIWGETVSGKKAGWLIDVGKIKVINE